MVRTKSPKWLPRLLTRCTPQEQAAIERYRGELGRAHSKHRNGKITASAMDWEWTRCLRGMEIADTGSPPFASYVEAQRRSQLEWRRRTLHGAAA